MKIFTLVLLFVFTLPSFAQNNPAFRENDRIRIHEAINIQEKYGDKIWNGWSEVPFAVLLVTDSTEFLIRHPKPSEDFQLLGYDSLLQSNIYYRKRIFSTHFLATFPAVNDMSTIVVGQPENTKKSSVAWIITLLHEHFHQLQSYQKDYYSSVNGLDLAGDDKTGMWMLNYPFPYDSGKINEAYDSLKIYLASILKSEGKEDIILTSKRYNLKKEAFKNLLNEKDYRYFSFQLWQEGIARYTELKIAKTLLDDGYIFSNSVTKLDDFVSLKKFYNDYYTDVMNQINNNKLSDAKRVCFYAIGAGESLLLDLVKPDWKVLYFKDKFYLEKYFR
jgi:hypothetical protein